MISILVEFKRASGVETSRWTTLARAAMTGRGEVNEIQ